MATASKAEIKHISMVSPRNWRINWVLNAPRTFRIPASRPRPAERAVARLRKLIQAMRRTNKATAEKI